ncbi:hypothetical protein [Halostella sp. PRR32]|uniref:hypothetical protein n=1 Tax=Halostella sp. PRR32 TaxID=3098147 RepID=UPI002B1E4032|nr:hypothetical protein [Halostella sp. PRR32]
MVGSSPKASLVVGCLTFGVAVLSFVIEDTLGSWPTPFGQGSPVLFAILGIALVSPYMISRVNGTEE